MFRYVIFHVGATLSSLHLRHSSFSIPSVASSTSQLALQPYHRFTYITAHSTTLPLLHLHHRHFTYIKAHSPILPPLHLRHSSFYNPSATSPTSQVILQPFCCFTYITGTSHTSPGEPPMHRGMKKHWTGLLQQVTKFRSSYSFG